MNLTIRFPRLRASLLAAALAAAHAVAEPVPDPTRPMGLTATELPAVKAPRSEARSASAPAPAPLPRLQSVQIAGSPGQSSALVDGRLVRLGDRVGDHSISAIDRNGLTLRGPRGEQRLPLLTGITLTASRATPPTTDTLATGSPQDTRP